MSARGTSGSNAAELKGNDLAIQQRNQPTHRAHETLGLAGTPVHILRPVEPGNFLGDEFA